MKIINPIDGTKHSVFDKIGRSILKKYIRAYKKGGTNRITCAMIAEENPKILQLEISLTDFFNEPALGVHPNDCVPNTLTLLKILTRKEACALSKERQSGIIIYRLCQIMVARLPEFKDIQLNVEILLVNHYKTFQKYMLDRRDKEEKFQAYKISGWTIGKIKECLPDLHEVVDSFKQFYCQIEAGKSCMISYFYPLQPFPGQQIKFNGHALVLYKLLVSNVTEMKRLHLRFANLDMFNATMTAIEKSTIPSQGPQMVEFGEWNAQLLNLDNEMCVQEGDVKTLPCLLDLQTGKIFYGLRYIIEMFKAEGVSGFEIVTISCKPPDVVMSNASVETECDSSRLVIPSLNDRRRRHREMLRNKIRRRRRRGESQLNLVNRHKMMEYKKYIRKLNRLNKSKKNGKNMGMGKK